MMNSYKHIAEKRHKQVHNFLVKNFPGCNVRYNGDEGIDQKVTFNGRIVYIETKTCNRIVKHGFKTTKVGITTCQTFTLGRFIFDLRKTFPYEPDSQHTWLVNRDGWYIFVVGRRILGGMPARDIPIKPDLNRQRISWSDILSLCLPNWFEKLNEEVYARKEE